MNAFPFTNCITQPIYFIPLSLPPPLNNAPLDSSFLFPSSTLPLPFPLSRYSPSLFVIYSVF